MAYNDERSRRVIFDIETAPLEEAASFFEPIEAPSNYKDPEKIASYIAEKQAVELARCALDVDLCRIVAIGLQIEGEAPCALVTDSTIADEAMLLQAFWADTANLHLVGFNCLGFDLPVLLRRSLYLGIEAPSIQIDRFKHPRVTDLMDVLSYDGKLKMRGLGFYCRRFGISVTDVLDGSIVPQAVAEGRWAEVRAHVLADVQKTAALAERLGYFSQAF